MPTNPLERATDVLVRPFSLGSLTLPNRVVMAPMTREFSPGGVPGPDVAQYYARRAAAGIGLIITEGTYIGHDSAGTSARVPHFFGDEALAGWSSVAEAVHQAAGTGDHARPAGRRRRRRLPLLHPAIPTPRIRGLRPEPGGLGQKAFRKPAISVGSVGLSDEFPQMSLNEATDIGELLDRMERDEFDLVAVGRALLGDPEWLEKILAGRIDELTPFHGGLLGSLH
ncbi:oxidoreductase [Nocardia sp. NPDC003345]